jgi:hypothetical protein
MKSILFVFAVLISAPQLLAQKDEPVRLAVISESDTAAVAADVLTAQLSHNDKIHLLERNEIGKIYHEQELSAGNRDYLKLGQILGADGLLLLESLTEGTNKILHSRLIAVNTGILLTSERFLMPAEDPSNWAAGFVKHLAPLLPKLTVRGRDAVPISMVNLRSAFQTPEERELERNLTLLTIDRLTHERQVFVLERRRMQLLSAEKELGGVAESAFWDGSYLLEGTIDRDGYSVDKVTLSARLVPPQGRAPLAIELRGSRTNISEIILQLTSKVLDHLKVSPGATLWKPADEANQYEDEARWALRWRLYDAAQSASESAWALGKRTPELAALRIRAYSEPVWTIREFPENLVIPAAPDAARLKPCIRALTLYCEDAPLALTNTARPDPEWFDLGVRSFERAACLLDGFYHAAELREGNEEPLAELRALTRRVLPMLDAQARLVGAMRPQFAPGSADSKGRRMESQVFQNYDRLSFVKWHQGGVCFDRPENAAPLFREMLEAGTVPPDLPRIIGWSWEDRQRVARVMNQFIRYLCGSTNPGIRLTGLYLSVLRAPNDGTGNLEAAEDKLLAALWEQRTNLITSSEKASLLAKTEEALNEKYGTYARDRFDLEPFASFRQRLRAYYLANASNGNEGVFCGFFPDGTRLFAKEEAQELLPLLEKLHQKEPSSGRYFATLRAVARAAEIPLAAANGSGQPERNRALSQPAAQPEIIPFHAWNPELNRGGQRLSPRIQRLIYREGKLWGMVCYIREGMGHPFNSPTSFVSVEQETGRCEEIAFPEALGYPDPGFDVSADSVFVSLHNKLARYRMAIKTWETVALPTESGGSILAWNDRVYFANGDNLLEIAPETHTIQVLASSRRLPQENELDSTWGPESSVFDGWGNKLGVLTTNWLFLCDLEKRAWDKIALPENLAVLNTAHFFSKGGLQLMLWRDQGPNYHRRLLGYSVGHAGPELLLEQNAGTNPTSAAAEVSPGEPRWRWPEPFPLNMPSFVLEGNSLWSLQPRKYNWFGRLQEPVQFNDDRNATLLRFGTGLRQALSVPLQFEPAGRTIDPFDQGRPPRLPLPGQSIFAAIVPPWFVTDKGVVVCNLDKELGHWLVSISLLNQRWETHRKSAQAEARPPTPSRATPETNSYSR